MGKLGRYKGLWIGSGQAICFITLISIFILVWIKWYPQSIFKNTGNYFMIFTYVLILVFFITLYGGFKVGIMRVVELIYSNVLALICTNIVALFELCLAARWLVPIQPMIIATIIQTIVVLVGCYLNNKLYFKLNPVTPIAIVCSNKAEDQKFIHKVEKITERYKIGEIILEEFPLKKIFLLLSGYDVVFLCDIKKDIKREILGYCYQHKVKVYMLPTVEEVAVNGAYTTQIFDTPVFLCKNIVMGNGQMFFKRLLDLVGAILILTIMSPIFLIVSVCIKIEDGGPVFFVQTRVTKDDKCFEIYKFRSMRIDAEADGVARLCSREDRRITKTGKWIRSLRIDELPQLFNVIKGDMSLVGPRPERPEFIKEYSKTYPEIAYRTRVKAGLTGLAQVKGKYNTTPKDKIIFDLMYIEQYSIWLDIKLLIMTIKVLFMLESTEGVIEDIDTYKMESKDKNSFVG